jgi:hypothetical protein
MRVIVHISDIHFGTEIPALIDALATIHCPFILLPPYLDPFDK